MPGPHTARADLYGAQPERTALAWQRSLLSVQLGSLLLTLTAVREQAWLLVVLGAALTTAVGWWLLVRGPARRSVGRPAPVGVGRRTPTVGQRGRESGGAARMSPAAGLVRLVVAVSVLAVLGTALALSRAVEAL